MISLSSLTSAVSSRGGSRFMLWTNGLRGARQRHAGHYAFVAGNKSQHCPSPYYVSALMASSLSSLSPSPLFFRNSHCFRCNFSTRAFTTNAIKSSPSGINNNDDDKQPPSNDPPTIITTGAEAFQRYQELCESIDEMKREKERIKSAEMYQAWQQASSESSSSSSPHAAAASASEPTKTKKKKKKKKKRGDVSAGVAVVQTLAKQTRQEQQQEQRQGQEQADLLQKQANRMLQTAALDFDHPEALVLLGNQLVERVVVQQEQQQQQQQQQQQSDDHHQQQQHARRLLQQALNLYQRAGELGFQEGWYNHGELLWTGYPDQTTTTTTHHNSHNDPIVLLPSDQDAAMESFWKAIDLGDANAMYFVGAQRLTLADDNDENIMDASITVIDDDEPLVADLQKGLDLVERAAKLGHSEALYYLALFHLNGHATLKIPACSPKEFVERLDAAVAATANNDDDDAATAAAADALFLRGHCYYHGENGYEHDYHKALLDFLKATDAGNADAAVSAAAMLHAGTFEGVPQDQEKAFELYQFAGELGNLEGWRNVVSCYARGEGVPQSLEMAQYIAKTMLRDEE